MDGPLRILRMVGRNLSSFDRFCPVLITFGTLTSAVFWSLFGIELASFERFTTYSCKDWIWGPQIGSQKVLIWASRIRPRIHALRLKPLRNHVFPAESGPKVVKKGVPGGSWEAPEGCLGAARLPPFGAELRNHVQWVFQKFQGQSDISDIP